MLPCILLLLISRLRLVVVGWNIEGHWRVHSWNFLKSNRVRKSRHHDPWLLTRIISSSWNFWWWPTLRSPRKRNFKALRWQLKLNLLNRCPLLHLVPDRVASCRLKYLSFPHLYGGWDIKGLVPSWRQSRRHLFLHYLWNFERFCLSWRPRIHDYLDWLFETYCLLEALSLIWETGRWLWF